MSTVHDSGGHQTQQSLSVLSTKRTGTTYSEPRTQSTETPH